MIKNIVFSGGGIFGFSICGALKALEENKLMDTINVYSGTSAGSIIACLLVLGYNAKEIETLIFGINFDTMRDITTENILSFFETYGVDSGNRMLNVFEIIIKAKTNNPKITFKQLFQLTKKKLIIAATNLSKKDVRYFNYQTTPNMPISLAVRISISIPILFTPIKYENDLYIDGCILDNFPIHLFPNDNHTLGIRLKSSRNNNINNIEDYITTIIYTFTSKYESLKNKDFENRIITINIPEKITQLQFDINDENKKLLIEVGYQQTIDYINNKNNFLYNIINKSINHNYSNHVNNLIINRQSKNNLLRQTDFDINRVSNIITIVDDSVNNHMDKNIFQKNKIVNIIDYIHNSINNKSIQDIYIPIIIDTIFIDNINNPFLVDKSININYPTIDNILSEIDNKSINMKYPTIDNILSKIDNKSINMKYPTIDNILSKIDELDIMN